ncbi:MAG: exopolyphosphatase [Gammaproteobacteria bacterium]
MHEIYAAVDLGSHSFHLLIARVREANFNVLDRLREPVRLAAGLDADGVIGPSARKRALTCLARFGERLEGLPAERVRAVGTNTLRRAANADAFRRVAEDALGHPIKVLTGAEEARLIYSGVAWGLPHGSETRLLADIGGGSTEVVIGRGAETHAMVSLPLGCVMFTERYFPDGRLGKRAWQDAVERAKREVRYCEAEFGQADWQRAIGSSGTVRAVQKVIAAEGWGNYTITRDGLQRLGNALRDAKDLPRLKLSGLGTRRRTVFPGGVAILTALFEVLDIEKMEVSDTALREGLLMDFIQGPAFAAEFRSDSELRINSCWATTGSP